MLNKNQKTCHYYSSFFLYPTPLGIIITIIIIIICKDWKNRVIFVDSVPGLPCAQKVDEKEGEKQEINSSEANTIPNSQYNINFGWWLAFILFCLDEQIYY